LEAEAKLLAASNPQGEVLAHYGQLIKRIQALKAPPPAAD